MFVAAYHMLSFKTKYIICNRRVNAWCGLFLLILLLFFSGGVLAGVEPYRNAVSAPFTPNQVITLTDPKGGVQVQSATDAVTLQIDDNISIGAAFTYAVNLKIDYYTSLPETSPSTVYTTLTVNYNPLQGTTFKRSDDYTFEGAVKIVTTILSTNITGQVPTGSVLLINSMTIVRNVPFLPDAVLNGNYSIAGNYLNMGWTSVGGAEEYDIEWTTIDEGSSYFTAVSQKRQGLATAQSDTQFLTTLDNLFREGASRVTTDANVCRLSLITTDPLMLVRLRAVHYLADGIRQTGNWNYRQGSGPFSLFDMTPYWHEPNLNWSYNSGFAEEAKKKEVVEYLDGSMRTRQMVTINSSDAVPIIQESVYDDLGRPVAQILPAPHTGSSSATYLHLFRNFNVKSEGIPFTFGNSLNLIGTNCEINPGGLSTFSGAGNYYSPANKLLALSDTDPRKRYYNAFIPDASNPAESATAYPFAVTQYTDDKTGRIKLSGGVGLDFQPGKAVDEKSHTTKYYYGVPEQWELNQLFGNDVGYANRYTRNMVVDPNGQISLSYQNGSGKTIATALAGNAPANVDALPSYDDPAESSVHEQTVNIINTDRFTFNSTELKLTATATHLATMIGQGTLAYDVQKLISEYPGGAFKLCSNCYYELTIKVTDDCGNVVGGTSSAVPVGALTSDCNDTEALQQSLTVNFDHIGAYFVTMELAFNEAVIENYTRNFVDKSLQSGFLEYQLDYIRTRFLAEMNTSACYNDCHTCQVELNNESAFVAMVEKKFTDMGIDISHYRGSNVHDWATALYNQLSAKCQDMQATCSYSPCEAVESQLIADVSPGGQYALFDQSGNPLEAEINVISNKFRVVFPILGSNDDTYKRNQFTIFENGKETTLSPNDANFGLQQLLAYWKPEWATKFLEYHPEYCQLQACRNQSNYKIWDLKLQEVEKVADLNTVSATPALVYTNQNTESWLLQSDPFFKTGAPGAAYSDEMLADLNNYSRDVLKTEPSLSVKRLLKYVEYELYCADTDGSTNSAYSPTSTNNWVSCIPVASCRVPDREWRAYRDRYIELKAKYYDLVANCSVPGACAIGQPLAYKPVGAAPATSDFQVSEGLSGDADCPGGKVMLITYKRGSVKVPLILKMKYPQLSGNYTLPDNIEFNKGDQQKAICLPAGVPVSGISVSAFEKLRIQVVESDGRQGAGCVINGVQQYDAIRDIYFRVVNSAGQPVTNHEAITVSIQILKDNNNIRWETWTIAPNQSQSPTFSYYSYLPCTGNGQGYYYSGCTTIQVGGEGFTIDRACSTPGGPITPPLSSLCQLYATKISRFPKFESSAVQLSVGDVTQMQQDGENEIKAQAKSICQENAARWVARLEPGLVAMYPDVTARNAARTALINGFVDVCSTGADGKHPFGVSELAPPDRDGNLQSLERTSAAAPPSLTYSGNYSFGDVIKKTVLANGGFTMTLNPWLIDGPDPYYPNPQLVLRTVSNTDADICIQLNALTAEAAAKGLSLYNYLVATYGTAMTLSAADLSLLQKACGNCKFLLERDLTLPVFLDGKNSGAITSTAFNNAMSDFNAAFASGLPDVNHANYPAMLRNFLNQRFGFGLTYQEYVDYAALIAANPATEVRLINKIASTTVTIDPDACLNNALEVALSNGQSAYMAYLEEHRQKFRNDYISTCRLAAVNANLTTTQRLYHYTLYYYDQADNLIQTVPPAGMKLIDVASPVINSQINDARAYTRDEGQAEFQANLPYIINNDKAGALNKLSATLASTSSRAIEVWLYSSSGPKQFIEQTPDQAFLFQVCVNGDYLNIDIYKAVPGTNAVQYTLSRHFAGNISKLVHPWTHVVIQSTNLMSAPLQVYCNGQQLTNLPDIQAGCGWQVQATTGGMVYSDNMATIKHLRFYERSMPLSEIMANARHLTFVPSDKTGMTWYRFNIPAAGGPTTIAANTTDETRLVPLYPSHTLSTTYAYNSTNQVITQQSPDGGTVNYWYDLLSRLVASQNGVQQPLFDYSYTRYDDLGRITEVGKKRMGSNTLGQPDYLITSTVNSFAGSGTNTEITRTYYDISASIAAGQQGHAGVISIPTQSNLRKRVSATTYSVAGTETEQATYYDYDLSGNVRTMWQQISGLTGSTEASLKRIDYEYDLISGKVNFVRYQTGQPDQFLYQYRYDAENRLTEAWSGTRGIINTVTGSSLLNFNKKLEAKYRYYLHGPLARMELGDEGAKVQGIDYAYTLQGWLKGVNSGLVTTGRDMGADALQQNGNVNRTIPADAFGYSLYYYRTGTVDYRPLQAAKNPFEDFTAKPLSSLFNGNIAAMSVNVPKLTDPHHYNIYRYDQLNRIKSTDVLSATGTAITDIDSYQETFAYDANGNIEQLQRRGPSGTLMDNLTYAYNKTAGRLTNNRLRHVTDAAADPEVTDDLKTQATDNYTYDAIGNLKKDVQAGIIPTTGNNGIQWNVYGKIVNLPGTNAMSYTYDAGGNRVGKTKGDKTTWYVRDAQGNSMAVYEKPTATGTVSWLEQHLYGSSRLGIWRPEVANITTPAADAVTSRWNTTGTRQYELGNHLGNVLATITDRRIQHIGAGNTMDYLMPDVASAQNYYAFGGLMPGRNVSTTGYRYGFNGKENDNEVGKGTGNQQDYGMRIYDPRVGRFLSRDPLSPKYPELTPYQFASNRPIDGVDLDGQEWENIKSKWIVYSKGVSALPIIKSDNGSGYLLKATYGLQDNTSKESFDRLKSAYLTNPGIVHNPNNGYAQYYPMKKDAQSKNLSVGDHMYIDITGPFNDYVRFTEIKVTDNTFYIKAATLYGHTDAGFITFSGSYDPTTGIATFSIYNETTNNLGLDALNPRSVGRGAQKSQWELVLNNVASFLKGSVKSKTLKTELSSQNAQKGDAVKVATEDLQSGKRTEEMKEKQ